MCRLVFYLLYTSTWVIIYLQLTSFCNLRTSSLISSMTVMSLIVKINKVVGAEKIVYCSTKSVLWCSKMCKIFFGRGSAPDPVGGAYDASPNPLVGWGGGYPLPIPYLPWHLRRLVLGAFGASSSEPPLLHIATLTTGFCQCLILYVYFCKH